MQLVNLRTSFAGRVKRSPLRTRPEVDPATVDCFPEPKKPCRRGVRFDESANKVYSDLERPEPLQALWYTDCEMSALKRDYRQEVTALRLSEKLDRSPNSWTRTMMKSYQACIDADVVVPAAPVDDYKVGLHKACKVIALDARARRHDVWGFVAHVQQAGLPNQDELIRKGCAALSKPSSRFAHQVALAAQM